MREATTIEPVQVEAATAPAKAKKAKTKAGTAKAGKAKKQPKKETAPRERDKYRAIIGPSNHLVSKVLSKKPKKMAEIIKETGLTPKQVRYAWLNELVAKKIAVKTDEGFRLK